MREGEYQTIGDVNKVEHHWYLLKGFAWKPPEVVSAVFETFGQEANEENFQYLTIIGAGAFMSLFFACLLLIRKTSPNDKWPKVKAMMLKYDKFQGDHVTAN